MKTLIDDGKQAVIRRLAAQTAHLSGVAIEAGVYQGGSLRIIAETLRSKPVYGFDTFEGMPPNDYQPDEGHPPGDFGGVNMEALASFFKAEGFTNVELVKGYFPDTGAALESICFAHLDIDYGKSIEKSLPFIWDRLVMGGILVIDDYDWQATPGVKGAVDQFANENGLTVHRDVIHQAWLQKVKSKTLGGYVVVRNGISLDYCFELAIESLLPVCDEVIACDSDSTDGTREALDKMAKKYPKLRVINWPWPDPQGQSHRAFVHWLNFARMHLTTDVQITLDADEVLDDNPLCHLVIRDALRTDSPARQFDRLNFWRDAHSLVPEGVCCGKIVSRMGPTDWKAHSDEPHEENGDDWRIVQRTILHPDLKIFHLGFLRRQESFYAKSKAIARMWNGDQRDPRLVKGEKEGLDLWETECEYSDRLVPYSGSYPAAVKAWLEARGHSC